MNLTSHLPHPPTETSREDALLGPGHPLARTVGRLGGAWRQLCIASAILVGSSIGLLAGASPVLAVAALVTALALAGRVETLVASRNACVLELIRDGRADLPIPAVRRTRDRLRRPSERLRLVECIEGLCEPDPSRSAVGSNASRHLRSEIGAPLRRELTTIAALLKRADSNVQGIALVEQLLFDGMSSLHGDDPRMLRDDLRRVRFLLESPPTRPEG